MGNPKLKGTALEAIPGRARIPELDFSMAEQKVSPDHRGGWSLKTRLEKWGQIENLEVR